MDMMFNESSNEKRESWNKKVNEFKSIDRSSPNAKEMLDNKFTEIYQIIYNELDQCEKEQAAKLIQPVVMIQDIKELDKKYTGLIKRGEALVFASKLQRTRRKMYEKYRHIPHIQHSSKRGKEYLAKLRLNHIEGYTLDIGCSDGKVAKALNEDIGNVIGMDIDIPEEHEKSIPLLKGDGCNLPFSNNSFNLVVYLNVIEHIPNPELSIKEVSRCLNDNGIAYIVYPNKYFPIEPHTGIPLISYFPAYIQDIMSKWLIGNTLNSYPYPAVQHFFNLQDVKVLFLRNGFEIIDSGSCELGDYLFPGLFNFIHRFLKKIRFYNICPHTLYIICRKKNNF